MQRRISRKGLVTVAVTILVAFLFVIGSPSISSAQSFNVHVDGFFGTPRPGMLWVWGWSGSTVDVTFEDFSGVYCALSDQPHEGPEGSSIRLGGTCAGDGTVQPGDIVTVTDGATTKSHTVTSVQVTGVDYENDIVSGTAEPGTVVYVQNHQGYLPTITIDPVPGSGIWIADYTEEDFDLTYCHGGEAWQFGIEDNGNSTQFGWFPTMWCTPADILTIFNGWVDAADLEGPGTRAAMRKLLELADKYYQDGNTEQTCVFLNIAYQMCDGLPKPKDIVWGDAQYELQTLFLMVMEMPPLQCE